ncbi:UDP-glucose:undecaprenyl-phosphate glucose-1-phosphate transferase [mine drainage metagenome]|uniref:UDP-glucose:undecaprenyl-phosphate glucose-1-phosphate transferase n=1 Tax=mine drainage metagenome TaxID=410659 RepID=A0A1J5PST3_9ZZZZ
MRDVQALPTTFNVRPQKEPKNLDGRRAMDVALSALALVFLAPLMIAVAIAIKLQDGGPVFFGHTRVGFLGQSFKCWKFRSMVTDAEARLAAVLATDPEARREWDADHKLRKDPRITILGRFLRASSLDELPQLFNILVGEMSLVGPRPIVAAEISKYGRWFPRYTAVKPGLTGLWQVSGRNDVTYRERVALDILYVRRSNFRLYLFILLMTVPAVLTRSGSY